MILALTVYTVCGMLFAWMLDRESARVDAEPLSVGELVLCSAAWPYYLYVGVRDTLRRF